MFVSLRDYFRYCPPFVEHPPPSPPGSVPPWITSGFSWSRVGLAKWFIRMQGSDISRLACFFKDLQSILWQCFTWKARYCNASLLLSPLTFSPQPYLSSTSRASSFIIEMAMGGREGRRFWMGGCGLCLDEPVMVGVVRGRG